LKLESLQLENIRSHAKTVVPFVSGFNCLVGGLGQGKSTVLYAFDFVLFGDPLGRSYNYLLREGADHGKVTAVFVHNGRTYKIQRALHRRGKGISQDIDQLRLYRDGRPVADTKNDAVAEELKTLTGLDKNTFREVVWVRQEHLKELLDITPRQRQTKLDKLFGLSDYDVAWTELRQFEKEYTVVKNVLERDSDVINIKNLEGDYNSAVEEFTAVTAHLGDAKEKVAQTESALKDATAKLEGLEELRETTEELQRREVQIQTTIVNLKKWSRERADQTKSSKRRLDELEKLLNQMNKQEKSHRDALQDAGLEEAITIEDLRNTLYDLEKQLRTIGGEQEATKREMKTSQNRLSSLKTENKCPTCLQELTGDYKKSLLTNFQQEEAERTKKLAEFRKTLDELKTLHSTVNLAFLNLQQLIPRIRDIKGQVTEKQETLTKLVAEDEKAQKQEKTLQKQLDETQEEIAKFDVSELEYARKLQKTAYTEHLSAKNDVGSLEQRKSDLGLRMDELKERLDNAQKKIDRKEKIVKLLGIVDRIRSAYRNIQPKLRSEFVTYLQRTVQQQLDSLVGDAGPALNIEIDETYSPSVLSEEGHQREVSNLSGGERTLLAFAYRIGLGQLIMQSRTGHGLYMLLLDEPTESLGREDGSVDRLAEAVSRLKAIEQIIAVTHNEAFAEKAEHVIRIEKEAGESQVFIEK
jgi:DNA repair protein SbcC/Rad50